jgi:hypothetical protein
MGISLSPSLWYLRLASRDWSTRLFVESNVTSGFDAYHKWLGIQPAEQPPDHYRLLGVARFEADREVLAAAADRQMAHVKSFAAGQHAAASQALLNELAKARVTLLNALQKEAYDRRLQTSLARGVDASTRSAPSGRIAAALEPKPSAAQAPQLRIRTAHHDARGQLRQRRRSNLAIQWLVVALGAAVVAGALGYAAMLRPEAPAVISQAPTTPHSLEGIPPATAPRPEPELPPELRQPSQPAEPAPIPQPEEEQRPQEILPPKRKLPLLPPPPVVKIHDIDLDLSKRVQRLALPTEGLGNLQIVGLRNCESPYKIDPIGGSLSREGKVKIIVSGARVAIWEVSINSRRDDETLLEVEGFVVTDDDQRLPFTLANVGRRCRLLSKQFKQAANFLESSQAEKDRLSNWLAGPGMKPLADVGIARARVRELERIVPEQSNVVQSLNADLQVAEQVQAFAKQLDKDCIIEISVAEK